MNGSQSVEHSLYQSSNLYHLEIRKDKLLDPADWDVCYCSVSFRSAYQSLVKWAKHPLKTFHLKNDVL